jgi:hypothetical protein
MKRFNCATIRLIFVGIVAVIVASGGGAKADFTFGEPVNLKSVIPVIDPMYESINCLSGDGLVFCRT